MKLDPSLKNQALTCARGIADFLCNIQSRHRDNNPIAGSAPWGISHLGEEYFGYNWNHAFATMGLLAASKAFNEKRYEKAGLRMAGWMKTLQVFDPFRPENYGAIREITPQTPWSCPRDALSVAWAFIEVYRHTGDEEYLERAKLFGEWFISHAIDEDGWPLWGVKLEPFFDHEIPVFRNDVQGVFHGGSLNLFYQLAQVTGDDKWTGQFYVKMADFFVDVLQQESGYFATVDRSTKKPPETEPQGGLHRANDDLGTLGLLGAYKVTGNEKYLHAIERFINAVVADQKEDGSFDKTVAAQPVVLNIMYEASRENAITPPDGCAVSNALQRIFDSQSGGDINPRMRGGLVEEPGMEIVQVWSRSTSYALIVLSKFFGGVNGFLAV